MLGRSSISASTASSCFFFSSGRRHTRLTCDWSSDVCSSDLGGILMGRLADRFGVIVPVVIGALSLGAGFLLCGLSVTLWQFSLAHGLLAGLLGCAATFAPLVADASMWFTRHRGMAVAICAS